jgi:hypothetical protein
MKWIMQKCKREWFKYRHPEYKYFYVDGIPIIANPFEVMMRQATNEMIKRVTERPFEFHFPDKLDHD